MSGGAYELAYRLSDKRITAYLFIPYRAGGTRGLGAHQVAGHAIAGSQRDDADGGPWLQIQVTAPPTLASDSYHAVSSSFAP